MKRSLSVVFGAMALLLCGCKNTKQSNDDVVSQKYIHKYGYAVSKDEFEGNAYPGQVVTLLRSGVTLTATYENGVLHGPSTHTFPNSQTVESYYLYNHGNLVKEILYDVSGMPLREEVQLSPKRYLVTLWYNHGTPMSIEEFAHEELLEGQYFNGTNDLEAQVVKGKGTRVRRDIQGLLLYKDQIEEGYVAKRETFYPNGAPESVAFFNHGKLHGEKRTYAQSGEPLAIKEYIQGKLHGKTTVFNNGVKTIETLYLDGMKNGMERHFLDGEMVAQEILWENDRRHGPSRYFLGEEAQVEYYYDGSLIGQEKWEELSQIDAMISQISPDFR